MPFADTYSIGCNVKSALSSRIHSRITYLPTQPNRVINQSVSQSFVHQFTLFIPLFIQLFTYSCLIAFEVHFLDMLNRVGDDYDANFIVNMEDCETATQVFLTVDTKMTKTRDLRIALLLTQLRHKAMAYIISYFMHRLT